MWEAALLRSHIDHRRARRSSGRKAPAQLNEFGAILARPNGRSHVRRPDVVPGLEVRRPARREQPYFEMAESFQIGRVRNSVAVIVTHSVISAATFPYLLHPYSKTRVISTDARMDPARPTRFEKKKNMLANVPGLQQFHMTDTFVERHNGWTSPRDEIAG